MYNYVSESVSIQYIHNSVHLRQPRHPGKAAASALPIGTLLAPPFPTGIFAGTFVVPLTAPSGLVVVEVLDGFVEGALVVGGELLREGLSRFSFSPAPVALDLLAAVGTVGSSLVLALSFDVRLFVSPFFTCATFRCVFFSLSGLSSSPFAVGAAAVTAGAGHPVGVVSALSGLSNASASGLSGESASRRMRLSGLGFTGE